MLEQVRVPNLRQLEVRRETGPRAIHLYAVRNSQAVAIWLLRISLAGVFFWFGMLKVAGSSPVVELLRNSFGFLASAPYLQLLGAGEVLIALGLLVPRFSRAAAAMMVMHLLCTLSLVFISPSLAFAPSFPILTMQGEFLAKNLVLISAGLALVAKKD
jgi:uncharacterized membrane protein YkgB